MSFHRLRPAARAVTVLTFAVALGLIFAPSLSAAETEEPEYYELRVYSTKSAAQREVINRFWEGAAIPAYERLGIGPIGVFTELEEKPASPVYVLIPFASPEAVAAVRADLAHDAEYRKAGAEYLDAPKSGPAYERFDSSLLVAFDGMRRLARPSSATEEKPWIFELRTYQSRSEGMGDNKVRMFNSGEIPLMREVGLSPVFFGQSILGTGLPNLVYMVSGESREAHKAHWDAFFRSPVWDRLKSDPQYQDNVSKVDSVFLKRTSASRI